MVSSLFAKEKSDACEVRPLPISANGKSHFALARVSSQLFRRGAKTMKRAPLFIAWMTLWCVVAFSQQPQRLTADQEQAVRVRYPQVWERKIAEGTKVAAMKAEYDHRLELIPASDLEDKQPLPLWFRAYLRDKHPDLPTSGPYQYPRVAERIL